MPECHSTNSELARLLIEREVLEGTVVITANQTAGKGQRGNVWIVEPNANLTFSFLIRPTFLNVSDQFQLSKAVALGVHAFLQSKVDKEVKIKWPNDILISDKKVCGILIENFINKINLRHSIIGVGLNVNQQSFEYESASSLKNFTGIHYDLNTEFNSLLTFIEAKYLLLRQNQFDLLNQEYKSKLYWLGEKRVYKDKSGEFEGTILGVDQSGRLKVETSYGLRTFDVKEVQYLR